MSDSIIWSTIGNKKFCSFKKKIITDTFCKNPYNITGICRRQSCPLANSRYATVLEEQGKMYLYVKTAERCHTPRDMWEKIPLHPNFLKSLEQVNKYLEFWPYFMRKKIKQRMTKIRQYLIRMRRLRTKVQPELIAINKHQEKIEARREKKAHTAAHLQDAIKSELLTRLREGTYGELYDDIVNFDQQVYNDALDDMEDVDFDDSDVEEFVEDYSDEEDSEVEIEYEMENEGKQKRRMKEGDDDLDFDDESAEIFTNAIAKKKTKRKHVQVDYNDDSE